MAGPRFNIIYGNNGQGKTNVLESISILGTLKSFRKAKNQELIKWGAPHAMVKGWVDKGGVAREITVVIDDDGKKARIDDKVPQKAADFFGCLNAVAFSPEEISMVRGLPELRRRYLDRAIFNGDVTYLSLYHEYSKVLKSRNILLRRGQTQGIDVWTEQLAELGARLINKRMLYVRDLADLLQRFYAEIAGPTEKAKLSYRPYRLQETSDWKSTLLDALKKVADEEARLRTTLVGPHRDDLEFTLGEKGLKNFGSQGQQRSFVLALKMAEIEYLAKRFGYPPILLLDDMTSELDCERNRNLMAFLNSREMQVFITTTQLENIQLGDNSNCTTFLMEEGSVIH